MTKGSKGKEKKGAGAAAAASKPAAAATAAAAKHKFQVDDKVFAMDGGDLYEARVRPRLARAAAVLLRSCGWSVSIVVSNCCVLVAQCQSERLCGSRRLFVLRCCPEVLVGVIASSHHHHGVSFESRGALSTILYHSSNF